MLTHLIICTLTHVCVGTRKLSLSSRLSPSRQSLSASRPMLCILATHASP